MLPHVIYNVFQLEISFLVYMLFPVDGSIHIHRVSVPGIAQVMASHTYYIYDLRSVLIVFEHKMCCNN